MTCLQRLGNELPTPAASLAHGGDGLVGPDITERRQSKERLPTLDVPLPSATQEGVNNAEILDRIVARRLEVSAAAVMTVRPELRRLVCSGLRTDRPPPLLHLDRNYRRESSLRWTCQFRWPCKKG